MGKKIVSKINVKKLFEDITIHHGYYFPENLVYLVEDKNLNVIASFKCKSHANKFRIEYINDLLTRQLEKELK